MTALRRLTYLRSCQACDDGFLYAVFATTWASEVAALPNQNLARHVLRIQHIAQERRLAGRYPGHDRFVVSVDGQAAGRLYVTEDDQRMHIIDLTLLPEYRSRGLGSAIVHDLFELASGQGLTVSLRVSRSNRRAMDLCTRLGFTLVQVDDLDGYFEWTPPASRSEDPEDVRAMKETGQVSVHHSLDRR